MSTTSHNEFRNEARAHVCADCARDCSSARMYTVGSYGMSCTFDRVYYYRYVCIDCLITQRGHDEKAWLECAAIEDGWTQ